MHKVFSIFSDVSWNTLQKTPGNTTNLFLKTLLSKKYFQKSSFRQFYQIFFLSEKTVLKTDFKQTIISKMLIINKSCYVNQI